MAGLAVLALTLPRLLPKGTLRAARGLPTVVALRGLGAGSFFAAEVFVPLMLVQERGLNAAEAGLALTGGSLAWSLGSWIQGRRPHARALTIRLGATLIAAGICVTAFAVIPSAPVLVVFAGWWWPGSASAWSSRRCRCWSWSCRRRGRRAATARR
ncbi:hypothetical protein [Microbispora sp. GKU 823]|uniref:hypothetical protein n=1 Tax=Microbispora sp. GKU 823 TaxID=1652100 RepID=UPI001C4E02FF|nr:hypothetical protein [Microbispora sp. GKU 823]